jgi:hypothetical protein
MRSRIVNPTRVPTTLDDLPITVSGATMEALRLDTKEFHDPLVRDLVREGLVERDDRRRGGRAYVQRLQVNYLRFNHVNFLLGEEFRYARLLEHGTNIVGFNAAYDEINRRVLDGIAERVPHLTAACNAQRGEQYLIEPEDIFRPYHVGDASVLMPLTTDGENTVAARLAQRRDHVLRCVPTMNTKELTRIAVQYHNKYVCRAVHNTTALSPDSSTSDLDDAQVRYLRDRSLGLDLRNSTVKPIDFGDDRTATIEVLLAIRTRYPALADACERCLAILPITNSNSDTD